MAYQGKISTIARAECPPPSPLRTNHRGPVRFHTRAKYEFTYGLKEISHWEIVCMSVSLFRHTSNNARLRDL